jgi:hypothetical protein
MQPVWSQRRDAAGAELGRFGHGADAVPGGSHVAPLSIGGLSDLGAARPGHEPKHLEQQATYLRSRPRAARLKRQLACERDASERKNRSLKRLLEHFITDPEPGCQQSDSPWLSARW